MNADELNVNIYLLTLHLFIHFMSFREIKVSAILKQPLATGQKSPELNNPERLFQTYIIIF